jgi:nuclear migration protein JNM1
LLLKQSTISQEHRVAQSTNMTQVRKYATLPDLVKYTLNQSRQNQNQREREKLTGSNHQKKKDESPDTYETPDLTDNASTLQTSITTAWSETSDNEATTATTTNPSISRSRLSPNQARTQFSTSRVDARETDFSDRVSSKRRAYVVSNNKEQDEDGQGDWDSQDEKESLQRKLARLNREVHEVQSELEKKNKALSEGEHDEEENMLVQLTQLSTALHGMRTSQSATARLERQLADTTSPTTKADDAPQALSTHKEEDSAADTQALNKVADFDARLAALERHLGITSLDMPEASSSTSVTPILPALSLLDRQLALLTSPTSQSHIDALAQKLQLHQQQSQLNPTPNNTAETSNDDLTTTIQPSPEELAKLRALYALLPTITTLTPTLPPLLARLRSLRTLHANAVTASQTLDQVEQRQDEADKEIREWKHGLDKVEEAVKKAEVGMRENNGVVEGWVRELEERVKALGLA